MFTPQIVVYTHSPFRKNNFSSTMYYKSLSFFAIFNDIATPRWDVSSALCRFPGKKTEWRWTWMGRATEWEQEVMERRRRIQSLLRPPPRTSWLSEVGQQSHCVLSLLWHFIPVRLSCKSQITIVTEATQPSRLSCIYLWTHKKQTLLGDTYARRSSSSARRRLCSCYPILMADYNICLSVGLSVF